jgi:putative RNA 2'-phosphotransferase
MNDRNIALSKWMSWALRHDPTAAGITLDHAGWTSVDALLEAAARQGQRMTRTELEAVVANNEKKRFLISDDGCTIRANQGHSVPVDLGLDPLIPPCQLFHGTADRFIAAILREGLRRQARQHVHLSADRMTATAVGTRHGRPVILIVAAERMHSDGHVFYRSANGVWLTEAVPATYLSADAGKQP